MIPLLLLAALRPIPAPAGGDITAMQLQKLQASDLSALDYFGLSVALDGDTAIVGSFAEAAYVYVRVGTRWEEQARLRASDTEANDFFGYAVAIDGDRAVVGAFNRDEGAPGAGVAYVFERTGTSWSEVQKLAASVPGNDGWFGTDVAIRGDTIAVGAPGEAVGAGVVHVFDRIGGAWVEVQEVTPLDSTPTSEFGSALAMDGNRLVASAPLHDGASFTEGVAYVFEHDGVQWVEQGRLAANAPQGGTYLGHRVAISGDTVAAGGYGWNGAGTHSGAVYIFGWNGSAWSEQTILTPSDSAPGDSLSRVGIEGDFLAAGAPGVDLPGRDDAGAVYVFQRQGGTWTEEQKLISRDPGTEEFFGSAVAMNGGRILIGAFADNAGPLEAAGAAYPFVYGASLGSVYCDPGVLNSSGQPGSIVAIGSDAVADDDLTLVATGLPWGPNIGYFIMGTGQNTYFPPGSAGPICVLPGLLRYRSPVSNTTDQPGGFSRAIGTSGPISGNITPGSTWNFQAWHRDSAAGTSNLTNAVSVDFQ